jgi:hypothetical protein
MTEEMVRMPPPPEPARARERRSIQKEEERAHPS